MILFLATIASFPISSYTSSSIPLRSHHFVRLPSFLQTSCMNAPVRSRNCTLSEAITKPPRNSSQKNLVHCTRRRDYFFRCSRWTRRREGLEMRVRGTSVKGTSSANLQCLHFDYSPCSTCTVKVQWEDQRGQDSSTSDSGLEMTATRVQEETDPAAGPPKRKNLRSLFKEEDCRDTALMIPGLKESLVTSTDDTLIRAESATRETRESLESHEGFNKLAAGVSLVQVLQSWACSSSSQRSFLPSIAMPEKLVEAEKAEQEYNSAVDFSTLVVREGDCLSEISRLVRVPINVLQRVNSIANIECLKPGQALLIPRNIPNRTKRKRFWDSKNKEEMRVIANWGDTLWSLAEDYNVSADEIRRANNMSQDLNHLYLGQELIIPSPQQTNCMTMSRGPPLRYLLRPENVASIPALRPLIQNKLVQALLPKWQPESFGVPCQGGWFSSLYGWKDGRWYFHNGIDIALERGMDVIASTSGKVTWSGWKGGYGKTVCIDHGNGFVTLYAHCDDLLVQPGQFVRKSQVIALSGSTGQSSTPHLHFEIHKDGKTVDPLVYLPPIYHHK